MAIDELLDEHEQGRRVQECLRRNGAGLVGGILLGLAAVYGWRWWQQEQVTRQMRAGDAYQQAIDAVEAQGIRAAARVSALPPGNYRALAALSLARAQVDAGQPDQAIATLRGAMPEDAALREVVELRIARLLLAGNKVGEALKTVRGDSAAVEELRGDAQVALGDRDAAREAYRKALAKAEVGSPLRNLIELKYTQVGGTPTPKTP
jgi:predicted negative regulator of RcsB-dependent stress response